MPAGHKFKPQKRFHFRSARVQRPGYKLNIALSVRLCIVAERWKIQSRPRSQGDFCLSFYYIAENERAAVCLIKRE